MNSADLAWRALMVSPATAREIMADAATDPWRTWILAVSSMAEGDYAGAFECLRPVARSTSEASGLAAAALASGMRQLDDHAAAVGWDEQAIEDPVARVDGLIGRAADEVGMLRPEAAAEWLHRAEPLLGNSRDRLRHEWVATEIALSRDRPGEARARADRALLAAHRTGSPRHVAKSLLFRAVCEPPGRTRTKHLHDMLESACVLLLRPLVWPAVVVLGGHARPREQRAAREAAGFIGDHLPPGVGTAWSRRADIEGLLAASPVYTGTYGTERRFGSSPTT